MENGKILIAVVDGQGGGLGRTIIQRLKDKLPDVHIRVLGTNATATGAMLRAGAKDGATGENALIFNIARADIITGPIGIIMPNGLLGELTTRMAEAIGTSHAKKILIPSNSCNISMAIVEEPVQRYIDQCIEMICAEAAQLCDKVR